MWMGDQGGNSERGEQVSKYLWTQNLRTGRRAGLINRPTRVYVREYEVELLGPVNFEPNLVRVRLANGQVVRVDKAELTPIQ